MLVMPFFKLSHKKSCSVNFSYQTLTKVLQKANKQTLKEFIFDKVTDF